MGYDWLDAEREDAEWRYIESIVTDNRDLIISDFVADRLASYFDANPKLAEAAEGMLSEATRLLQTSPSACLVFAMTSIELSVQDLLLKPVVAGLSHHAQLGTMIAGLLDLRNGRTEKVLFVILQELGVPPLADRSLIDGVNVWKERDALKEARNQVIHRGKLASPEEAQRGLVLAEYFLRTLCAEVRATFTPPQRHWM